MMEAWGDCVIASEPGVDAYASTYLPEFADSLDTGSPKTFEEVEKRVLSLCKQHTFVCIKEMGFAAKEYLLKGELGNLMMEKAHFVFLVRNPHSALISYYKVWPEISRVWSEVLSYENLYSMYKEVDEKATHKPIVIMVDDLVKSPETVIKKYVCISCYPV